ncbi:MAG TPA: aminotransferase class IV [Gammaproteobacteria bacterium]|nr:aminotransferase class IV [Gammaproteobacteria bacterium]
MRNEFQSMTNVDGVVTRTADARIPVLDRGFLYGDSIYEVFRTYDGVPLFYDEHWARFQNSASLIRMDIGLSQKQLTEEIRATIETTGAPELGLDVYVRYMVTRGEGPVDLFPSAELKPRYVIVVREVPKWNPEFYSRGLRVAVAGTRRNPGNALDPNIKGGNYLNNVLGVMDARALGADDCLMLNDAELVTEASNSNVFFVIGGKLVTPAQTAANLRGLTKAAVHEACAARGLQSTERDIHAEELRDATECFLTSATREVMPVVTLRPLDGKVLRFAEGGGPITRRVAGYYRDHVAEYLRDHAHLSLF